VPRGKQRQARFDRVRYASVWEDADVLCAALEPVARGGRLFSIASAGDNALALLTLDPAEVVAVDLSRPQLACLELRVAALRRLDDAAFPAFLGADPVNNRLSTYANLRDNLCPETRAFWDARPRDVAGGILHAGKFERYLELFRRRILPLVHSRATVATLASLDNPEERARFYAERWDTPRWRLLFRLFFNRTVQGRLGRDPAFLAHAQGDVAGRLLQRARLILTGPGAIGSPYLARLLTGSYPPHTRPRYLRPEYLPVIRERLDRLRWVQGAAGEGDHPALAGPFHGFNLSNIFEYASPEEHVRWFAALAKRAETHARFVYWNLLVPRGCPASLAGRARPLPEVAAALHARDQIRLYEALHVDEILPGAER
jgi:S-adenosylmethionine-diacylglycerol 3-amino-3-carboxypropyl transferase